MLIQRLLFILAGLALLSSALPACSTPDTQNAKDAKPIAEPLQPSYDPEVSRYLLGERAPLLVKLNMHKLQDQFGTLLQERTAAVDGAGPGDQLHEMVAPFLADGPLRFLFKDQHMDKWSGELERDRSWYLSLAVIADDSYFTGLNYGAVVQTPWDGPRAARLRMMLPTKTPQETAKKIREALADAHLNERNHAVLATDRFVIIDSLLLDHLFYTASQSRPLWKAVDMPEEAGKSMRNTPALARFMDSSAPISAYIKSEDLRQALRISEVIKASQAILYAAPDARQALQLGQVAPSLLTGLSITPLTELEHEDTLIELAADANGHGLLLDATHTLTERGRQLAALNTTPRSFSDMPAPDTDSDPLAGARWNFDLAELLPNAPLADDSTLLAGEHGSDALFTAYRSVGWNAYIGTALMTPTLPLRRFAQAHPGTFESSIPAAGAFEVALPKTEDATLSDMRAGATLFFAPTPKEPDPNPIFMQHLTQLLTGLTGQAPTVTFTDAPSGQWASAALAAPKTQAVELSPGEASAHLDLGRLVRIPDLVSRKKVILADWAGPLTEMHLRTRTHDGLRQTRLHLGAGAREFPDIKALAKFTPQKPAPPCTNSMLAAAAQTFETAASADAHQDAAQLLELLADYDTRAEECAAEHPEIADELTLARARMRGLLLQMVWQRPASSEAIKNHWEHLPDSPGPAIEQNACELGDRAFCPTP